MASYARSNVGGKTRRTPLLKIPQMQKKVPSNRRYKNVASVVDSGMNMAKFVERPVRIGEIFTRMRCKELHELLVEHEELGESIYELDTEDKCPADEGEASAPRAVSKLGGAVDAAEGVVVQIDKAAQQELDGRAFLLLDMRPERDFQTAHIRTARSYPALNLRQDKITKELFRYKNQPGLFVVIYSTDERESVETGTLMVQKGFRSVLVVAAGISEYARRFPEDIEGDLKSLLPAPSSETARKPGSRHRMLSAASTTRSSRSSRVAHRDLDTHSTCQASQKTSTAPWKPPA